MIVTVKQMVAVVFLLFTSKPLEEPLEGDLVRRVVDVARCLPIVPVVCHGVLLPLRE
jgi:hypothetical protein